MVEHKQVEHKPTTSADVVVIAKPLTFCMVQGKQVFAKADIAAERERWTDWLNTVINLNKQQVITIKAQQKELEKWRDFTKNREPTIDAIVKQRDELKAALDGEHRRADAAVSALDKAEARVKELEARGEK